MSVVGASFSFDSFMQLLRNNATVFFLVLLCLVGVLKGYDSNVRGWGVYFWLLDYQHGFIMRGGWGSLMSPFIDLKSGNRILDFVQAVHLSFIAILIAALAVIHRIGLTSQTDRALYLSFWVLFAVSQFIPHVAFHIGYVDLYLFLCMILSVYLLVRGWLLALALVGLLAPLMHELFVFLWLPVGLLALWKYREELIVNKLLAIKVLAVISTPFISYLLITLFHSSEAVRQELLASPLDAKTVRVLLDFQFSQGPEGAFSVMWKKYVALSHREVLAFAFHMMPTCLMIAAATFCFKRKYIDWKLRSIVLTVASLLPLLVLLFAWDLSRFLVISSLSALLSFYLINQEQGRNEMSDLSQRALLTRKLWLYAVVPAITVVYLAAPLCYAFFENMFIVPGDYSGPIIEQLYGEKAKAVVDWYNIRR